MLLVPRVTEALYLRLLRDPVLGSLNIPGGIWRDQLPQDGPDTGGARLPAIVLTFVLSTPNAAQKNAKDLIFECRAEVEGTDFEPVREAMDRVDVLLGTAEGSGDGWSFKVTREPDEIQRTSFEAQETFAALGGQYVYTAVQVTREKQF